MILIFMPPSQLWLEHHGRHRPYIHIRSTTAGQQLPTEKVKLHLSILPTKMTSKKTSIPTIFKGQKWNCVLKIILIFFILIFSTLQDHKVPVVDLLISKPICNLWILCNFNENIIVLLEKCMCCVYNFCVQTYSDIRVSTSVS